MDNAGYMKNYQSDSRGCLKTNEAASFIRIPDEE